jgi:hypothetical protein
MVKQMTQQQDATPNIITGRTPTASTSSRTLWMMFEAPRLADHCPHAGFIQANAASSNNVFLVSMRSAMAPERSAPPMAW